MTTGDLRHMEVSREWLSATRNGVRALNLKRANERGYDDIDDEWDESHSLPAALNPSPDQFSNFPNLESLFLKGISVPPIECSIAPSLPNLKVLHYTYTNLDFVRFRLHQWGTTGSEEYLRALLQGCMQLRELRCDFQKNHFHLLREMASLTTLTSLSLYTQAQGKWYTDSWGELSGAASLSDTISRLVRLQELTLCGPTPPSISPACFSPDSPLRSITLRCENLEQLPHSFTTLHRLESLELNVNSFRHLPDLIPLTSLTRLDVQGSGMKGTNVDWSCLFSDLPRLRVLRVSSIQSLRQLPEVIGCYTSLEVLHLLELPFSSLPESFGQLRSLTELKLESCRSLTSLPESFCQLQSLQQLVVDHRDTHHRLVLPETVELPSCLTSLTVCLAHLPDSLWSCLSLQKLHVENLESASLPEAVGQLTSLTELTISHCPDLVSLPASLQRLPLLQSVTLSYCFELSRVVPQRFHPKLMNVFGMVHGRAVPPLEFLIRLPSLTSLTLYYCNSLTRLPGFRASSSSSSSSSSSNSSGGSGGGGSSSSRLARICITHCNGLSHLPQSLGSLTSLTYLELAACYDFLTLPHSMGGLSSLASIVLSNLDLKNVPESFGLLSSLRVLQIIGCHKLRRLPHSFGQLRQLTSLTIQSCPLELLPGSQGQLTSLRELLIDGRGITLTPELLPHLPALTSLKILWVKQFPPLTNRQAPGLGLLPSLKTLPSAKCGDQHQQQQQLPKHLWQVSRLTSLTMRDFRKLRSNPDSLLDMPALERLEVVYACLSAFPPAVSRLRNLTSLVLHNASPQQGCPALPDWICQLPALKRLSVGDRYIEDLPEGLGSLSKLESLWIKAERLQDLPASLGQLGKLTELILECCKKLQRLPDSFTQLVRLKRVWLMHCCLLASVPMVDGRLPGGCKLVQRECPRLKLQVNNVHVEVMSEGDKDLCSWHARMCGPRDSYEESDEE